MPSPAQTLKEARNRLSLEPLENDQDYADLSSARGSNCLARLETELRQHLESGNPRCHLAFVGHRGSGKSTELIRLADRLHTVGFPIQLTLDATLHEDADYPDLFLWLVEKIATRLKEAPGVSLDDRHGEDVANWYASVAKFDTTTTTAKVGIETSARATAGTTVFGTGFKLLASLKSAFIGSKERRTELRKEIKNRADELIQLTNNFLFAATAALKAAGKPHRILIIQDNLDRLDRLAALALFRDSADIIQKLNAAFVWTAPVGTLVTPFNINTKFKTFFMPMISVRKRTGKANRVALDAFHAVIAKRMETSLTFGSDKLIRDLALASGGSVRELIKLTEEARLNATTEGRGRIEAEDIRHACKQAAIAVQNSLIPTNIYFPILAQISADKEFIAESDTEISTALVETRRDFFHTLVATGAVFAYNGDDVWFDVNPNLLFIPSFKKAIEGRAAPAA